MFYQAEDLSLGSFFATRNPDEDLLRRVYAALDARNPKRLKGIRSKLDERGRRLTASVNLLERAGAITSSKTGFTSTGVSEEEAVRRAVNMAGIGERVDRTRVDMMRSYAETPDCRRHFLLGYFGDHLPGPCGNCDTCRAHTATEQQPAIPAGTAVEHREWGAGACCSTSTAIGCWRTTRCGTATCSTSGQRCRIVRRRTHSSESRPRIR